MTEQKRPLSPHLQWYKPQITSMLSIMHRASGMVLALGLAVLVLWVTSAGLSPGLFDWTNDVLTSWLGQAILIMFSAALAFHLFNGIRHLIWDAGYGFEINQIYASGYLVLVATGIATAGAAFLILAGGA